MKCEKVKPASSQARNSRQKPRPFISVTIPHSSVVAIFRRAQHSGVVDLFLYLCCSLFPTPIANQLLDSIVPLVGLHRWPIFAKESVIINSDVIYRFKKNSRNTAIMRVIEAFWRCEIENILF